jgi:caspase domain-containing protein
MKSDPGIFREWIVVLCMAFTVACYGQSQDNSSQLPEEYLRPEPVPRFALVIGAQHYDNLDPVENALNDAFEVVKSLQQTGFSSILSLPDPKDDNEIFDYVDELAQRAGTDGRPAVTVFFFAGHGFQDRAFPYIVPVTARRDHLVSDSVSVAEIMRRLATHRAGLAIFLLDSCRTGVSESATATSPDVASPTPFSFSAPPDARGAILGLATEFGYPARSAAHDGDPNSPYTTGLITYIPRKALSLALMLEKVKTFVQERTRDRQSAVVVKNANETGFYFVPTESENNTDNLAWMSVLKTNRAECARWYIDNHPGSPFLKAALRWQQEPHSGTTQEGGVCPDQ